MSQLVSYRPEIDGLRAIAVTSVVIYHADLFAGPWRLAAGGYLGVDIFFVISGYLIGLIILRGAEAGTFSILEFYTRRCRRIAPALLVVLAACFPMAWLWMGADQFVDFARSAIATLFFGSNILFWTEDSYTAVPSALKPLLHTWSLGVEEQYYILFPLAAWWLVKQSSRRFLIVVTLSSIASLLLAHWMSARYPSASFFLLPTRAWEMLAGAMLAKLEIDYGRPRGNPARGGIAALGAVLILVPIFFYDHTVRHPGLMTIIPVIGTCLVIWFAGAQDDLVTRVLSSALFVGVGLISYSAYLWHQPLFAFARIYSVGDLSAWSLSGLVGLTIALGALSWRFIERPFRDPRRLSNFGVWRWAGAGSALVALVSLVVVSGQGYPQRMPQILEAGRPAQEWWQIEKDGEPCHRNESLKPCTFNFSDQAATWVLIGDSHAGVLARTLHDDLRTKVGTFHTFLWGGCPVIFGVDYANHEPGLASGCFAANAAKREFLRSIPPSTVVYVARMAAWIDGTRFDNHEGGVEAGDMRLLVPVGGYEGDRVSEVKRMVTATVSELLSMGHTVVLIYPIPEVGWNVPATVRKIAPKSPRELESWIASGGLSTSLDVFTKRNADAYGAYDAVGESDRLIRVYPAQLFCSPEKARCYTHDDSNFYYSDDDHLSSAGARIVVDEILRKMGELDQ